MRFSAGSSRTQGSSSAEAQPLLRFSRPANDIKGANESEIGILFFDEKEQPPARGLQEWPGVHRALIQRLNELTCSHADRDS